MCVFTWPVIHVGSTEILVSGLDDEVHATAYRMAYEAPESVAMVLPVPVRQGSGEDAVSFVDLSGYRELLTDLDRCFPAIVSSGKPGGYGMTEGPRPMLTVHEVGDYVASYVPSIGDFDRLDPRFRLPATAWDELPDYAGFGFVVVQLRPGEAPKTVQPIAYRYPAERPGELFFPTVHLHDGGHVHARATFDHVLYAQPFRQHENLEGRDWYFSRALPGKVLDLDRAQGLVAGDRRIGRLFVRGEYPNADIVLHTPSRWPTTEARLARVPWDLGPSLSWAEFEGFRRGRHYGGGY